MTDNRSLGDAPIDSKYDHLMNGLARGLDEILNGDRHGTDRDIGFVLMVFAFDDTTGRCNYISNGDRADVIKLLEDQLAKFKAQPC